jgi:hypothetical protein
MAWHGVAWRGAPTDEAHGDIESRDAHARVDPVLHGKANVLVLVLALARNDGRFFLLHIRKELAVRKNLEGRERRADQARRATDEVEWLPVVGVAKLAGGGPRVGLVLVAVGRAADLAAE